MIATAVRVRPDAAILESLLDQFEALRRETPAPAYDVVRAHVERALDLIEQFRGAPAASASQDAVVRVGLATWSTPEIELGFLCNRVVHIQRLIAQHMGACGFRVPEGFGTMELQPLSARSSTPPSTSLWRLLDEIESVVGEIGDDVYRARFVEGVSGSIGEHVRHCLDHVSALLTADARDTLSYDSRRRGTDVETDPGAALREIDTLKRRWVAWSSRALDEPIRVRSLVAAHESIAGWSTLGRELAFVVNHTIHHQAIIGVLLAVHGHTVPHRFGHSPSTPRRH